MKEKKGIKLKTIMISAFILLIVIGIMITVINHIKKEENIDIGGNKTIQKPNQQVGMDNLTIQFAKLENNKQNMVYSPLSIKYALKMLGEGANGNTKVQIDNLIGDSSLTRYENIDKVLSLANSVYIRDRYSKYVKSSYKDMLTQKYNAEIKYDAFSNANNVNRWIENKTFGIIKNMIRDDLVQNPDCEMLLINALAIDMEWNVPFSMEDTYGEKFYLENGKEMIATTMHKKTSSDSVDYYKDNNVTALAMDLKRYGDTTLQFIGIMPNSSLENYVKNITIEDIDEITSKMQSASKAEAGIEISVPKFSFDYDLKLKQDLVNMGMTDAFDGENADFSNVSDRALCVSDALHRADIDFTEKGVKAAAVTVFAMMDNAMIQNPQKPEEIKLDKPFLFIVKDKETNELWFIGTMYEPNSWEEDKNDYQPKW